MQGDGPFTRSQTFGTTCEEQVVGCIARHDRRVAEVRKAQPVAWDGPQLFKRAARSVEVQAVDENAHFRPRAFDQSQGCRQVRHNRPWKELERHLQAAFLCQI